MMKIEKRLLDGVRVSVQIELPGGGSAKASGRAKAAAAAAPAASAAPLSEFPLPTALYEDLPSLDELEARYLRHVLGATGGNVTHAAHVLGVDRRTVYRMGERLGLSGLVKG